MVNGDGLYEYDRATREYTFPDKLDFQKEPFATVIPARNTAFKVHKTEGLANSALAYHKQGAKYKQENGAWVKVWEFYDPEACEKCTLPLDPTRDQKPIAHYYREYNKWYRSPLHKGAEIFSPFLCKTCYDEEKKVVDDRYAAKQWAAEQRRRKEFDAALDKK